MGNTANSTLAGGVETLNCCTAVDGVDQDDDLEPRARTRPGAAIAASSTSPIAAYATT